MNDNKYCKYKDTCNFCFGCISPYPYYKDCNYYSKLEYKKYKKGKKYE